jgi:hypothetical protein
LAQDHLWKDLHGEWIPNLQADEKYFAEFQRLIAQALNHARFDNFLKRSSELAFGTTILGAASGLSLMAANKFNLPPEIIAGAAPVAGYAAKFGSMPFSVELDARSGICESNNGYHIAILNSIEFQKFYPN